MNCDKADILMMDSLMGALSVEDRRQLDEHLAVCERCRDEVSAAESLWQDLGDLDESRYQVPSEELTQRFQRALAEYESDRKVESRPGLKEWWTGLWAARPAWQAAFSAALLVVGVLLGAGVTNRQKTRGEIEQLRAEIDTMSRAVTISLLQHQSASERLRAVSWSRMTGSDERVLSALLRSVRQDPNVNVRLAAVDALAAHADTVSVRRGLLDTLGAEESPLVQLALLEAVAGDVGLQNGELEKLIDSGVVEESVLQHFAAQAESL